jgi:hypothetical protein
MKGSFNYLKDLEYLRRISRGGVPTLNQLESVFLGFSRQQDGIELTVIEPELYIIRGDEINHLREAIGVTDVAKVPKILDNSGQYDAGKPHGDILIASATQYKAGPLNYLMTFLSPILEEVYISRLVQEFTLREVLVGQVTYQVSGKDITDFPQRISPGPYEISAEFDTANNTIEQLKEFERLLGESQKEPKAAVLSPNRIDSMLELGLDLRDRIGALRRYEIPEHQSFFAKSNYVFTMSGQTQMFWLYKNDLNILVYFGKNPYEEEPIGIEVYDGNDSNTLRSLIVKGYYKPSEMLLEERIKFFSERDDSSDIVHELSKAKRYFERFPSSIKRTEYILDSLPPELIEFVIYPNDDDPLLYLLLPRLSWSEELRQYHDSQRFISGFRSANAEKRKAMLNRIPAPYFSHMQNNDVNLWLYQNHRELCENNGVNFRLVE